MFLYIFQDFSWYNMFHISYLSNHDEENMKYVWDIFYIIHTYT